MAAEHLEILVEEPSMEAFLRAILPTMIGEATTFEIYPFQGKADLLARLGERLRGYAAWLPMTWRIIVVLDRDDDDCVALKDQLETAGVTSGLQSRRAAGDRWRLTFRIAIEELEAWYFGEWAAVRCAYPRVRADVIRRASLRHCDRISGGTWEAFERELQRAGYFVGGLRKIEAAREIGARFAPERCSSPSFACFHRAVKETTR